MICVISIMSQLVISGHFPNPAKFTIHRLLFINHYSSNYYSSFSESVRDSEQHFKNFTIHWVLFMTGRNPLFICIIHYHVNWVYGYSNSSNQLGLAANSCIISEDISCRLELVCTSSVTFSEHHQYVRSCTGLCVFIYVCLHNVTTQFLLPIYTW